MKETRRLRRWSTPIAAVALALAGGGQNRSFIRDCPTTTTTRPVRRHRTALRTGHQLRRWHELRARLQPGDRVPRGRGLLRRAAEQGRRRHAAHRVPGHPRHRRLGPISQGRALRDTFVRNNGCTAQSPRSPREPAPGSRTHIVTTYSGCRAGYPVGWAAVDGGEGRRTWTSAEVWKCFTGGTTPADHVPAARRVLRPVPGRHRHREQRCREPGDL
jgi:hypothetical protein